MTWGGYMTWGDAVSIDFDLVELRCKLRGWKCVRPSHGGVEIYDRRRRKIAVGLESWSGVERKVFNRPRLTLADIVANPPEGWKLEEVVDSSLDAFGFCRFEWRARYDMPDQSLSHGACVVRYEDGRTAEAIGAVETERVAAHRAVADLLVLLAEVQ